MPKIEENNTLTLVNASEGKPDLSSEVSRQQFEGAYILYNNEVYKIKIVAKIDNAVEAEDFSIIGNKASVSLTSNRQLIDFDDVNGPFKTGSDWVEVELTDEELASRPFREYWYKPSDQDPYTRYGGNMAWPPQVTLYEPWVYLEFKKVSEAPADRKAEYENITGKYFATAVNKKGNREIEGKSSSVTIYEPADISYTKEKTDAKDFDDYIFIPETKDGDTVIYHPVVLEAKINHDDHNPTITHVCKYLGDKTITATSTFGDVPANVAVATKNNKETITVTTAVPGYYQVNATSKLNRKEKTTTSKICAVYKEPTTPVVDSALYYVGESDS
jgi:hypothetical protein